MSGLLVKEYYALRRYAKQYVLFFIFFGALSIYMESMLYFQCMVTMSMCMLIFTGMSYDTLAGWDKFVLTMPVNRKDIVGSKYLCCIIYAIFAIIASTLFSAVLGYIHPMKDDDLMLLAVTAAALLCIIFLIYSILIPLIYKLGVEKTRIVMIAVIMIPIFGLMSIYQYIPASAWEFIEQHIGLMAAAGAAFCVLVYIISYFVSLSIFNKKEY